VKPSQGGFVYGTYSICFKYHIVSVSSISIEISIEAIAAAFDGL